MSRVRGLVEAEASLNKQIADLEKKEAVYTKTIQVTSSKKIRAFWPFFLISTFMYFSALSTNIFMDYLSDLEIVHVAFWFYPVNIFMNTLYHI